LILAKLLRQFRERISMECPKGKIYGTNRSDFLRDVSAVSQKRANTYGRSLRTKRRYKLLGRLYCNPISHWREYIFSGKEVHTSIYAIPNYFIQKILWDMATA